MFVEGDIEVKVKDRQALTLDEHDLKLWLQRSFKDMSCYRISNFKKEPDKTVRAQIALKIADLPDAQRLDVEAHANDAAYLRGFLERMFTGKGTCKAVGEARLRKS